MNQTAGAIMQSIKSNTRWVREWMSTHPEASVDDAARAAAHAGRGLHKSVIADLRRDMREELRREASEEDAPALRVAEEQEVATRPSPSPSSPASAGVTSEQSSYGLSAQELQEGRIPKSMAGVVARKRWMSGWLEEHPAATVRETEAVLLARFGVGISTIYVSAALRAARETAGLPISRPGSRRTHLFERDAGRGGRGPAARRESGPPALVTQGEPLEMLLTRVASRMGELGLRHLLVRLREDGQAEWTCEQVHRLGGTIPPRWADPRPPDGA